MTELVNKQFSPETLKGAALLEIQTTVEAEILGDNNTPGTGDLVFLRGRNNSTLSEVVLCQGDANTGGSGGKNHRVQGTGNTVGNDCENIDQAGQGNLVNDGGEMVTQHGVANQGGGGTGPDEDGDDLSGFTGRRQFTHGFANRCYGNDQGVGGSFNRQLGSGGLVWGSGSRNWGRYVGVFGQGHRTYALGALAFGAGHIVGLGLSVRNDQVYGGGYAIGSANTVDLAHGGVVGRQGRAFEEFQQVLTADRTFESDSDLGFWRGGAQVEHQAKWANTTTDAADQVIHEMPLIPGDRKRISIEILGSNADDEGEVVSFKGEALAYRAFSSMTLSEIDLSDNNAGWKKGAQLRSTQTYVLRCGKTTNGIDPAPADVATDATTGATGAVVAELSENKRFLSCTSVFDTTLAHGGVTGAFLVGEKVFVQGLTGAGTNPRGFVQGGDLSGGAGTLEINRYTFESGRNSQPFTNGVTIVGETSGATAVLTADQTDLPKYEDGNVIDFAGSGAQLVLDQGVVHVTTEIMKTTGKVTVVDYTLGALGTIDVKHDGTITTLTEGTDFATNDTDNDTTAENIKVAIDGIAGVTATRVGAVVTVVSDDATKYVEAVVSSLDAAWKATLDVEHRANQGNPQDNDRGLNPQGGPNGSRTKIDGANTVDQTHVKGTGVLDAAVALTKDLQVGSDAVTAELIQDGTAGLKVRVTPPAAEEWDWLTRVTAHRIMVK